MFLSPGTGNRVSAAVHTQLRLPQCVCGALVSSQHAGLGAKLASLKRKSQAAEELR